MSTNRGSLNWSDFTSTSLRPSRVLLGAGIFWSNATDGDESV